MPRILYVRNFHPSTRARDLAYEFERYGPLIRCDVPAPRNPRATAVPYAFVEFRSERDAEDAYYEMHDRNIDGYRIEVQWAKNPPSSEWRYDRRPPPRSSRYRSRSPRRRDDRDRDRDRDERDRDRRRRSRSPEPRRRSVSPRRSDEDRRRDDRPRTPPLAEDAKREDDKARTPPYRDNRVE
ncbi:RNA-binding domain-containing protein [Fistulina hepatica ATCC 64428]|uniref:RNA-binding domain-containing protein n=1 Tax=Fistulina hepatica ATCC 64428 TaxID=1128425 RepID=A0A0D7A4R1_9AGAR|nr:RNA-binding domain-containing protein [Fistulina hepatica ATCC 64428]